MEERIQKLVSQAGIASRRSAETLISQGRVTVNGQVAKLGAKADPAKDEIRVDGTRLQISAKRVYVMLHKPTGVVTTARAQEQDDRKTVLDLVRTPEFVYPVGRLDADSEGLLLLTNDGELALKLQHPRYGHPKIYEVAVYGSIIDDKLDTWRRGMVLDDGPTRPVEIRVLSREKTLTWLRITMQEGRKRQIRRIAKLLGHPVRQLIRVGFATLTLDTLERGQWRYLTDNEVKALYDSIDGLPLKKTRSRVRRHATSDTAREGESRPAASRTSAKSKYSPGSTRSPRSSASRPTGPRSAESRRDQPSDPIAEGDARPSDSRSSARSRLAPRPARSPRSSTSRSSGSRPASSRSGTSGSRRSPASSSGSRSDSPRSGSSRSGPSGSGSTRRPANTSTRRSPSRPSSSRSGKPSGSSSGGTRSSTRPSSRRPPTRRRTSR